MQAIKIILILVLVTITKSLAENVNITCNDGSQLEQGNTNATSSTFFKVLKRSPDQAISKTTPSTEGSTNNKNTPELCSYYFGKQCDGDTPIILLSASLLKVLTQKEP